MKLEVEKELVRWKEAWDKTQECAVNALTVALPGLGASKTPTYCCPVTLSIDRPNELGTGRICVDDDIKATVELDSSPNPVIAEAVDALFGIAWFDGADGPLGDEGPGTYNYDDEMTGGEYEVELGTDGAGRVYIACVPVGFAVEFLDALSTAQDNQRKRATPV
ncbi:hypothetical protein [Streptomyces sp. NBC_01716]|uniref:hypothetical protein n=1 Tax=Streptomyces sp. NBC_01716 TaxID=2975917 RepID=UPI002E382360|nr:hypothetical protein [Streptomyces sp. NBC_01716]